MDDSEIMSAMRVGALAALAGLAGAYDKYATPLYSYCYWLLGEPAVAAEALRDTFLFSMTDLRGVGSPERLRPQLYAVARDECRQRQQPRTAVAPTRQPPANQRSTGLRGLIADELASLDDREREVVELVFRHGLSHADLAFVLSMPRRQVSALVTRIQARLVDTLAAPIVAYTGTQACPKLNDLLSGWDGRLTLWTKGDVEDHISECLVCESLRYQAFHPAIVYALESSAEPPPEDLRAQVIALCVDNARPERTARGEMPAPSGGYPRIGAMIAFAAIALWGVAAVCVTLLTFLGSHP
jgi:DNA-directed RNA polymerase specialized sigma24 family protein